MSLNIIFSTPYDSNTSGSLLYVKNYKTAVFILYVYKVCKQALMLQSCQLQLKQTINQTAYL